MQTPTAHLLVLFCLFATLLPSGRLAADSGDPLEVLTDVKKAYVNGLKRTYADPRKSLGNPKNTIGSEAFGAL